MDMSILIAFIAAAVLFLLVLVKIFILFRSARRKTLRRWLYFNQREIVEAPTLHARGLRKAQNNLTLLLFVLSAVTFLLLLLFRQ